MKGAALKKARRRPQVLIAPTVREALDPLALSTDGALEEVPPPSFVLIGHAASFTPY